MLLISQSKTLHILIKTSVVTLLQLLNFVIDEELIPASLRNLDLFQPLSMSNFYNLL